MYKTFIEWQDIYNRTVLLNCCVHGILKWEEYIFVQLRNIIDMYELELF